MNIAQRFILFVSLPVLACLIIMSVFLYVISSRALEGEYEKRLFANARQAKALMADDVERVKSDLTTLLASRLLDRYFMYVEVGELDYEEDVRASLEETFLTVSKAKPEYASLRIFRLDGKGVVNITDQRNIYHYPDPRQTEWFSTSLSLRKDEIQVSGVSLCPEHQAPSIFISQLVYYWDEPKAVASIHLHTQTFFEELLRETSFGNGLRAYLVDGNGKIIAHSDPKRQGASAADSELVANVLSGHGEMRVEPDSAGSGVLMKNMYLPLGIEGAVVVVGQPLQEVRAMSYSLRRHLSWISVMVALGLIILIFITVRTIIKPLGLLEKITKKIAEGDLDARAGMKRKDEIGSLSSSFDSMAASLQLSQEELRQAKATLENIFNNVIPLCITSKNYEILRCNDAYKDIFGKPEDRAFLMKCYDSRPGPSCHTEDCPLHRILAGEKEVSYEVTKEHSSGTEHSFIVTTRPFLSADQELIGIVSSFQDITERKRTEEERKRLVAELQDALAKVKLLSGFLPICASCKKIRDDKGYWNQIESYIRDHSEAEFSHGICPECAEKLYPGFNLYGKDKDKKK